MFEQEKTPQSWQKVQENANIVESNDDDVRLCSEIDSEIDVEIDSEYYKCFLMKMVILKFL